MLFATNLNKDNVEQGFVMVPWSRVTCRSDDFKSSKVDQNPILRAPTGSAWCLQANIGRYGFNVPGLSPLIEAYNLIECSVIAVVLVGDPVAAFRPHAGRNRSAEQANMLCLEFDTPQAACQADTGVCGPRGMIPRGNSPVYKCWQSIVACAPTDRAEIKA